MPIDPITGLPTNSGDAMNPGVPPPPPLAPPIDAMNPPAAGTPGAPGTWNYPDYQGLLAKWLAPYQQQYEGDVAAGQAGLDASTATARQRYQEGDTSTIARLKGVHDDNLRALRNSLNARGLLGSGVTLRAMGRVQGSGHGAGRLAAGSGEVGYQAGRENLSYKRSRYDAENQLLDYLKGLQQAFADAKRQGLLGLQDKRMSLAEQLSQIYQPTWNQPIAPSDPTDAQPPPPPLQPGAPLGYDPNQGYIPGFGYLPPGSY